MHGSRATAPVSTLALRMTDIRKTYPGVVALDGVSLDVRAGEVHVLLGANGAGKSTLMKVLSGAVTCDSGAIEVHGAPAHIASPRDARALGIAIVHQELALVPALSVAENLHLGRIPHRLGVVDSARMRRNAHDVLARLGVTLPVDALVGSLSIAQQQLVEIARALLLDARILVLDEPTSALTERETQALFGVLADLRARGVAIIYISHRLEEIAAIGDRVTVLRDGRHVATHTVASADRSDLVRLMAGSDVADVPTAAARSEVRPRGPARLRVDDLRSGHAVRGVSFTVHAGEVVGLTGLLGAGRTETARALFGCEPQSGGTVLVDDVPVRIRTPRDAIRAGIGFVTEDRKAQGLVLDRSVRDNIALATTRALSLWGVMRSHAERALAQESIERLRIRTPSDTQRVRLLSGGNQQKVVLAKWLATGARVLLLDEPTRGVDVHAKQEIYRLIADLAAQGTAVLVISSELPEVVAIADRTLVMRDGRIVSEFDRAQATPERLLACAVGHDTPALRSA
ncbi:MAG: sugar ABC transporter ATP-binding protein [Gemmatimonadetes bacterium]|nr:sugar ABC transporter ATP-binding protein [Gemmatimonadota bacterium]